MRARCVLGCLGLFLAACGAEPAPVTMDAVGLVDTVADEEAVDGEAPDEIDSGEVEALPPLVMPDNLSGGFVDLFEALEAWPPFEVDLGSVAEGREPEVTFGVFADLNGGKSLEVILSGAVSEGLQRKIYGYDRETQTLFEWESDPLPHGAVSIVEDLDGDGHVDAVMTSGGGMFVRWGDALGQFGDETLLASNSDISYDDRTTFHLVDLDQDGWLDLLMNSPCDLVALFRTGPRTWTQRPEALQGFNSLDPYAIATWLRPDEPMILLALGQHECGFYGTFEASEIDAEGYPLFEPVHLYEDASLQPSPDGMVGIGRIAPMGADVADLNRDGVLDLVMTTDPAHVIIDGTEPWPATSPYAESGLRLIPSDSGLDQVGWGVALVDMDKDGLEDVIVAHGDDTSRFFGSDPSPGPQWATLHLNGGDFRFLDATEHLGLGRRGGWRSLTVGDLDSDADPDLIVGGLGEAPRLYRNDIETPNRSLAIRLQGTSTNRLGIGARLIVNPLGTAHMHHYVVGAMGSPKAVSPPLVYAGLGPAAGAHVTVHWPSGQVQTVSGLVAGQTHTILEPELITLSPADRHLSPDEVATLTIRTASAATAVTVTLTHGDGVPSEAVQVEQGLWQVEISPPPTPGSARLEIRVDGQPLAIRPRLWWDAS